MIAEENEIIREENGGQTYMITEENEIKPEENG